jgi:hypothetical protein
MVKVCIGEGYGRMGHKLTISKNKPYGAVLKRNTKYFKQYSRGIENIFIAKKGVKLEKCK